MAKIKVKQNFGFKILYAFLMAVLLVVCSVMGLAYQRQSDELALTQGQIAALTTSVTESNDMIADLQDEIDDKTTTVETITAERDELQSEIDTLTEALASSQSELADIQSQLSDATNTNAGIMAQIEQLNADIADIQAMLDASAEDNADLRNRINTMTEEKDILQSEFDANVIVMDDLYSQIDIINATVQELQSEINTRDTTIAEQTTTIDGLNTQIRDLNAMATSASAQIAQIKLSLWDYALIQVIDDQTFTGNEIQPAVTVSIGDVVYQSGVAYTVTYSDNIEIGTATVVVTGLGAYAELGTKTTTFAIWDILPLGIDGTSGIVWEYTGTAKDIVIPSGYSISGYNSETIYSTTVDLSYCADEGYLSMSGYSTIEEAVSQELMSQASMVIDQYSASMSYTTFSHTTTLIEGYTYSINVVETAPICVIGNTYTITQLYGDIFNWGSLDSITILGTHVVDFAFAIAYDDVDTIIYVEASMLSAYVAMYPDYTTIRAIGS